MSEDNKIIEDCVDINNNIKELLKDSRFPMFINKIRVKYYSRSLLKTINKMQKSNQPLSKYNIEEIINYTYNSFISESGKFGHIVSSKEVFVGGVPSYIISIVKVDNIIGKFKIDYIEGDDSFILNIKIDDNDSIKTFDNNLLYTMETTNENIKDAVDKLNMALLEDMYNYIIKCVINE